MSQFLIVLELALNKLRSKFLTSDLQRSTQALERSTTLRALTGTNPLVTKFNLIMLVF